MRKSTRVKNAFVFLKMENLASTSRDDIVCVLFKSSPVAHTSRPVVFNQGSASTDKGFHQK